MTMPTEQEIRNGTDEQLNRWAAEMMGWEWFRIERHYPAPRGYVWERAMREPNDTVYGDLEPAHGDEPIFEHYGRQPASPITDIAAAMELEEALPRDWQRRYVTELGDLVGFSNMSYTDYELRWLLIHASPRDRTIACLLAWRASQ